MHELKVKAFGQLNRDLEIMTIKAKILWNNISSSKKKFDDFSAAIIFTNDINFYLIIEAFF